MILVSTTQVELEDVVAAKAAIFIGASGYETRATHLLRSLDPSRIRTKIAFGFRDRITSEREDNDRVLKRAGIPVRDALGDSGDEIEHLTRDAVSSTSDDPTAIIVDYSSMTRIWYAAILDAILKIQNKRTLEVFFSYSPAVFSEPHNALPNDSVGPIRGFCGLDDPNKPSALVIGLGYERDRALALLEYVDPAVCYLFYTDPAFDSRYRDAVVSNNADLIAAIPPERIYRHPFHDMQHTGNLMLSLYQGLRDEHRVIFAPLGIKPFSLLSLLLGAHYQDIDVWRVTSGTKSAPQDRKALGPVLVLKATFQSEAAARP